MYKVIMPMVWLVVLIVLLVVPVQAADYYVATTGNDSTGTGTEALPWRTIVKCVNTVAAAGNTCLVKNGTYPETNHAEGLRFPQGGTTGNPFTLKAYPGHSPVIDFGALLDIQLFGNPSSPFGSVAIEGFEIRNCQTINLRSVNHFVLRRNYIHNCRTGVLGGGWAMVIEQNIIAHNGINSGSHGLYISGKDFIIRNNLIYGNSGFGIQMKCADLFEISDPNYDGCANWQVLNNTIAYNAISAVVVWGGNDNCGGCPVGNTSGTVFGNNIFYENLQTFPGTGAQGITYLDVGAPNNLITHNITYNSRGEANYYTPNTGQYTLVNDDATNPQLASAPATRTPGQGNVSAAPDLHLTANSTNAINTGLNYTACGFATDKDGVSRPSGGGTCATPPSSPAWERGAYEFGGTVPDTTPPAPPTGVIITKREVVR